MRTVTIRAEMIRLGQLLKLADAVESGADVKALLEAGAVTVNGVAVARRGRQLVKGDIVNVGGDAITVC